MHFFNSQVWSQTGQIEKKVFVRPSFLSAEGSGNAPFTAKFGSISGTGHSKAQLAMDIEAL